MAFNRLIVTSNNTSTCDSTERCENVDSSAKTPLLPRLKASPVIGLDEIHV